MLKGRCVKGILRRLPVVLARSLRRLPWDNLTRWAKCTSTTVKMRRGRISRPSPRKRTIILSSGVLTTLDLACIRGLTVMLSRTTGRACEALRGVFSTGSIASDLTRSSHRFLSRTAHPLIPRTSSGKSVSYRRAWNTQPRERPNRVKTRVLPSKRRWQHLKLWKLSRKTNPDRR